MLSSTATQTCRRSLRAALLSPWSRGLATSNASTRTAASKEEGQDLAQKAQDAAASAAKSTGHDKTVHSQTGHDKTVAEQDRELAEKLAGRCDDGGAAGVEYEDGKPVAQKRSVRNNMFRLI